MEFIIKDYRAGEETVRQGGKYKPDYQGCITISTNASLVKMIAPGALVILSPLLAGILWGPAAVEGLLAGAIVSGVQVAISASNTGGAWDNCKKEIEKQNQAYRKQVQEEHGIDVKEIDDIIKNGGSNLSGEKLEELRAGWKTRKEIKNAAVVGDTVGDPLKDTSGPAINILVKLSAIVSLVFGSYIANYHIFNREDIKAKTE